ncbi:flagellar biosynthesis protein FlhF [Natranaerofaba carboxydovora]|uniref:flagellar biosynthesis protein FlhF n=1 Tax=Natranaerofaba carboxydovora TaxID=2742683 RepID=UPI001F14935E|nr:flagellar biosynthesis protein FlhF [Natranaerofaba carboxydovora]UMZ73380.1 Flagellar biosynthesis protein FlhF [Natranaerofaba carboxydovora]
MRVKKYVANTEKEAIQRIKNELGSDAIILNSKKVKRNGLWGLFGKKNAEVTVAIDETGTGKKENNGENNLHKDNQIKEELQNNYQAEAEKEKLLNKINEVKQQVNQNTADSAGITDPVGQNQNFSNQEQKLQNKESNNKTTEIDELKEEINETKSMMQNMLSEFKKMPLEEERLPPIAKKYYNNLKNQGVLEEINKDMINNTLNKVTNSQLDDEYSFFKMLGQEIYSRLDYSVKKKNNNLPEIITLIGPTGVGKTTTVAKLAARFTLAEKKKVGLVTVDTYRIAAVEQLKTYGDILSLPVEVVLTPQELKNAIKNFSDKDVILIDTAGRSHRNEMQMSEIKNFIETGNPSISYLVLSLGTKYEDLKEILRKYENIRVDGYIFTKTDETETMGNILNIVSQTKTGFSYITTGQDVPDDIEKVDINKITKILLGD